MPPRILASGPKSCGGNKNVFRDGPRNFGKSNSGTIAV